MKNPKAFSILLSLNILYGLSLLLYPVMLIIVAFSGDGPSSRTLHWSDYAFAIILISYPLGPLLSYFCWLFYKYTSIKWAYITANLPLLWVLALVILITFGW
ncbi:hypothetical protein RE628_00960 [Paenibacillus sp. D2_2]|uniref:hypothetical protein n=1 Tax=Paenibacillus sp. D2_2 TaxID=3073092 RepID=UPI00281506AE|nr:hypothetical protein [Paenibacillus sp. D2_2]WMT41220.1 hypothetical protein RE628_00960 [Paenibacillus sp. D2_2]